MLPISEFGSRSGIFARAAIAPLPAAPTTNVGNAARLRDSGSFHSIVAKGSFIVMTTVLSPNNLRGVVGNLFRAEDPSFYWCSHFKANCPKFQCMYYLILSAFAGSPFHMSRPSRFYRPLLAVSGPPLQHRHFPGPMTAFLADYVWTLPRFLSALEFTAT